MLGASRSLIVGRDKADAAAKAHDYVAKTFANYQRWRMQERTLMPLQLDFSAGLDAWTIHGSPQDCVETIQWAQQESAWSISGSPPTACRRMCRLASGISR